MPSFTWTSQSPEQTYSFGRQLAGLFIAGDVVIMSGDLGSGKTQMTKGIADGLGVVETVTSPSFVLRNDYAGRTLTLSHLDVYRLGTIHDLDILELDDPDGAPGSDGRISVVEWGQGLTEHLGRDHLLIDITLPSFDASALEDTLRRITLTPSGPRWTKDEAALFALCN